MALRWRSRVGSPMPRSIRVPYSAHELGAETGASKRQEDVIMHHVMVRYKLKPDQVERNLALLRDFYRELESTQPETLRYATYQLEDEVSFVHLHASDSHARFAGLAAFQRFRSTLEERCEEPPVMIELHVVGSFRFL